mmetsp:Transcript_3126/g.7667  ORF Transcript_3126/g.7667 Transcript_3126/m.7667 type:complete len:118 (+) Transcript_3126:1032-1385(+)
MSRSGHRHRRGFSAAGSSNARASNSWFSATRTPLPNSAPRNWRSAISLPDSTVSADTLKPPRKRSRKGKLKTSNTKSERTEQRTRKIRMRLSKEQKKNNMRLDGGGALHVQQVPGGN